MMRDDEAWEDVKESSQSTESSQARGGEDDISLGLRTIMGTMDCTTGLVDEVRNDMGANLPEG